MSNLVAVFQIGSLGDSIVSIPTLLSLKELIPNCSEYLLVTRFDTTLKVVPGDIFEMAWKPKAQLQYAGPSRPLLQLLTVPVVLAKLRYYKPKFCVSLMPADREADRIERDRKFFKAGGVNQLLGFDALPRAQFEASDITSIERTEAYLRFKRIWGDAASEKFGKYSQVPLMQPPKEAVRRTENWLNGHRKYPERRLVAISPYSNWRSRDIPDETIAALLPLLADKAGAEIVIVGGNKDSERAAGVISRSGSGLNACGVFSAQESAALLKACSLALCTDSGPMHLASAVGTPLLVTYSRTNPQLARWFPMGQRSNILYRDVPCAGCFALDCPVEGHPCMTQITVDQILSSALKMLNGLPVVQTTLDGTRVFNLERVYQ